MKPTGNPLVKSYWRMARRSGAWTSLAIAFGTAGLITLSLINRIIELSGSLVKTSTMHLVSFVCFGIGGFLLIGARPIMNALSSEHKDGLFESNRLTPIAPVDLVFGYLVGPALPGILLVALFTFFSFSVVAIGTFPVGEWIVIQAVFLSTCFLFASVSTLLGVAWGHSRLTPGSLVFLILFLLVVGASAEKNYLTSFLIPVRSLLILTDGRQSPGDMEAHIFNFGISIHLYTFLLQASLGCLFFWACVRKIKAPDQPVFKTVHALVIYGVLVLLQNGLVYPDIINGGRQAGNAQIASFIFMLTIGAMLLMPLCRRPEEIKKGLIVRDISGLSGILLRTGGAASLIFSLFAILGFLPHQIPVLENDPARLLIVALNILVLFASMTLVHELIWLKFPQKAWTSWALVIFVTVLAPALSPVFLSHDKLAHYSLFAPAFELLSNQSTPVEEFVVPSLTHLVFLFLLTLAWARSWATFSRR